MIHGEIRRKCMEILEAYGEDDFSVMADYEWNSVTAFYRSSLEFISISDFDNYTSEFNQLVKIYKEPILNGDKDYCIPKGGRK